LKKQLLMLTAGGLAALYARKYTWQNSSD